jgi:phospholipid/cholesterol/gamma-HCH transport system substrate-binding protein
MTFMSDWAMSGSGFDGEAHYFNFKLLAAPSSPLSTVGGLLPPLSDARHDPFNPERPNPNGPQHSTTKPYLPLMPPLPNPDGPNNGSHTTAHDAPRTAFNQGRSGATGLTSKQEHDMVGQLLGGR